MSYSSHISIQSLQCPYNTNRGSLALGHNYPYDTNLGLYHPDNSPKVFELHPSLLGTGFSGDYLGSRADTSMVHSSAVQYLPNCEAQDLHLQFPSHYLLLGGMSGHTMSWAPSNEPKAELKDTSVTPSTSTSPERARNITPDTPAFLDIKGTLLPEISPHVQEAVDPKGRRQWYCTFPHCTRSPFLRRDRAEIHVASVHLNKKSVYCNGGCGTVGW